MADCEVDCISEPDDLPRRRRKLSCNKFRPRKRQLGSGLGQDGRRVGREGAQASRAGRRRAAARTFFCRPATEVSAAVAAASSTNTSTPSGTTGKAAGDFVDGVSSAVASFEHIASTAALTSVAGLQKKHYSLVPKKLDEKTFWVNFFTQLTAIVG